MAKTIPVIPPLFLERMSRFLGDEYPAFEESLAAAPKAGLRVNTLKLSADEFQNIAPFVLGERLAWCPSAFLLDGEEKPGKHPYHMAGLYYLQDPSAMSPAELLFSIPMRKGERVLDLSAAPGGKTTHLAALMHGSGLLVANEIKNKRVGHLVQNVERWGAGNVVVTNETPERLADHFGAFFDRVLVDAPCSGEGMFRKDMGARLDWSPEMVAGCSVRQGNILRVAAKLVKPGGYLLYSTCTFAPEEDEGVIAQLLDEFPNFAVVELPLFDGFARGKPEWLDGRMKGERELDGAVRLFPHRLQGEGHFACLLRKLEAGTDFESGKRMRAADEAEKRAAKRKDARKTQLPDLRFWREFARDALTADLAEERLCVTGERLYYLPEENPDFGRLRVVHRGVWLGSLKKGRFEPAHPLALFLKPGEVKNFVSLPPDSRELAAYLRGENLQMDASGWTVVCADAWPLGWGKGVQGTLKNHFPRGWM
jgi:NOL1/NOP2/sun family putative RNA methylase